MDKEGEGSVDVMKDVDRLLSRLATVDPYVSLQQVRRQKTKGLTSVTKARARGSSVPKSMTNAKARQRRRESEPSTDAGGGEGAGARNSHASTLPSFPRVFSTDAVGGMGDTAPPPVVSVLPSSSARKPLMPVKKQRKPPQHPDLPFVAWEPQRHSYNAMPPPPQLSEEEMLAQRRKAYRQREAAQTKTNQLLEDVSNFVPASFFFRARLDAIGDGEDSEETRQQAREHALSIVKNVARRIVSAHTSSAIDLWRLYIERHRHHEREVASTTIARIIRGFLGRRRVKRLREVRQMKAEEDLAWEILKDEARKRREEARERRRRRKALGIVHRSIGKYVRRKRFKVALRRHLAARSIQRLVRYRQAHKLRKILALAGARKQRLVTRVQAAVRGYFTRRDVRAMKARKFRDERSKLLDDRDFVTKLVFQEHGAARVIGIWWRFIRRFPEPKFDRQFIKDFFATKIQAAARGFLGRRYAAYLRQVNRVNAILSDAARAKGLMKAAEAVKSTAAKGVANAREEAINDLQATLAETQRRWEMRKLKKHTQRTEAKKALGNAFFGGKFLRFTRNKGAINVVVIQIQRWWRTIWPQVKEERRRAKRRKFINGCATKINSAVRRYLARCRYYHLKRRRAATNIQKTWRGMKGRARAWRRNNKLRVARWGQRTIRFQIRQRRRLRRLRLLILANKIGVKLQSIFRGFAVRRREGERLERRRRLKENRIAGAVAEAEWRKSMLKALLVDTMNGLGFSRTVQTPLHIRERVAVDALGRPAPKALKKKINKVCVSPTPWSYSLSEEYYAEARRAALLQRIGGIQSKRSTRHLIASASSSSSSFYLKNEVKTPSSTTPAGLPTPAPSPYTAAAEAFFEDAVLDKENVVELGDAFEKRVYVLPRTAPEQALLRQVWAFPDYPPYLRSEKLVYSIALRLFLELYQYSSAKRAIKGEGSTLGRRSSIAEEQTTLSGERKTGAKLIGKETKRKNAVEVVTGSDITTFTKLVPGLLHRKHLPTQDADYVFIKLRPKGERGLAFPLFKQWFVEVAVRRFGASVKTRQRKEEALRKDLLLAMGFRAEKDEFAEEEAGEEGEKKEEGKEGTEEGSAVAAAAPPSPKRTQKKSRAPPKEPQISDESPFVVAECVSKLFALVMESPFGNSTIELAEEGTTTALDRVAIVIQQFVRDHMSRKSMILAAFRKEAQRDTDSARCIQCAWRCYCARQVVGKAMSKVVHEYWEPNSDKPFWVNLRLGTMTRSRPRLLFSFRPHKKTVLPDPDHDLSTFCVICQEKMAEWINGPEDGKYCTECFFLRFTCYPEEVDVSHVPLRLLLDQLQPKRRLLSTTTTKLQLAYFQAARAKLQSSMGEASSEDLKALVSFKRHPTARQLKPVAEDDAAMSRANRKAMRRLQKMRDLKLKDLEKFLSLIRDKRRPWCTRITLCVECGFQAAAVHCTRCKESFCDTCYRVVHSKGGLVVHPTKPLLCMCQVCGEYAGKAICTGCVDHQYLNMAESHFDDLSVGLQQLEYDEHLQSQKEKRFEEELEEPTGFFCSSACWQLFHTEDAEAEAAEAAYEAAQMTEDPAALEEMIRNAQDEYWQRHQWYEEGVQTVEMYAYKTGYRASNHLVARREAWLENAAERDRQVRWRVRDAAAKRIQLMWIKNWSRLKGRRYVVSKRELQRERARDLAKEYCERVKKLRGNLLGKFAMGVLKRIPIVGRRFHSKHKNKGVGVEALDDWLALGVEEEDEEERIKERKRAVTPGDGASVVSEESMIDISTEEEKPRRASLMLPGMRFNAVGKTPAKKKKK